MALDNIAKSPSYFDHETREYPHVVAIQGNTDQVNISGHVVTSL